MRQWISSDEGYVAQVQHTKPCSDCPFARAALPGWLGDAKIEDWVAALHGESRIDCHVITNQQCAGAAIYRANVCKKPRDKTQLALPPDRELVFARPAEFTEHHREKS